MHSHNHITETDIMTDTTETRQMATARRPDILSRLRRMLAVMRQRRQLRDLDPHLLDDLGLSRQQAAAEADRPVWDVPRHWRK